MSLQGFFILLAVGMVAAGSYYAEKNQHSDHNPLLHKRLFQLNLFVSYAFGIGACISIWRIISIRSTGGIFFGWIPGVIIGFLVTAFWSRAIIVFLTLLVLQLAGPAILEFLLTPRGRMVF